MDLGLKDKVAIVTGSARGLGAATARRLAEEGAKVVVTDIHARAGGGHGRGRCRPTAWRPTAWSATSPRRPTCSAWSTRRWRTFGGVHILVNNAGFPRDKYLVKMSEDDWDFVMAVMLKGAFLATKAVMPHMIEQGWGRVINISSRAHLGNPTQANYSAAKAGLIGMAKALAIEEGRYGVTVQLRRARLHGNRDGAGACRPTRRSRSARSQAQPIKRVGRPDDIADAVAFLASERAGFISGEVLHVTGGRYG